MAELVVQKAKDGDTFRRKQKRRLLGKDGSTTQEIGNLDSMLAADNEEKNKAPECARKTQSELAGVPTEKKAKKI